MRLHTSTGTAGGGQIVSLTECTSTVPCIAHSPYGVAHCPTKLNSLSCLLSGSAYALQVLDKYASMPTRSLRYQTDTQTVSLSRTHHIYILWQFTGIINQSTKMEQFLNFASFVKKVFAVDTFTVIEVKIEDYIHYEIVDREDSLILHKYDGDNAQINFEIVLHKANQTRNAFRYCFFGDIFRFSLTNSPFSSASIARVTQKSVKFTICDWKTNYPLLLESFPIFPSLSYQKCANTSTNTQLRWVTLNQMKWKQYSHANLLVYLEFGSYLCLLWLHWLFSPATHFSIFGCSW